MLYEHYTNGKRIDFDIFKNDKAKSKNVKLTDREKELERRFHNGENIWAGKKYILKE